MRFKFLFYIITLLVIFAGMGVYPSTVRAETPDGKQAISIPNGLMTAKEQLVTKVQAISVRDDEAVRLAEEGPQPEPQVGRTGTEETAQKEVSMPRAAVEPRPRVERIHWEEKKVPPANSIGNSMMDYFGSFFKESGSIATLGAPDKSSKKVLNKSEGRYDLEKEMSLIRLGGFPKTAPERLSLEDCIEIALHNHLPLQTANKSLKLAQMRVNEAKRNLLPTLTIQYDDYNGIIFNKKYLGRKQFIEGQQPIYHGGELYYGLKQAESNLEVTRNDYKKIEGEVMLQVKKGYYTLAKAKGNLIMQQELSANVDKIYDMVKKELEANIASRIEFLNVSSQASQVKYQLLSAEGDLAVAELILKQAMSVEPDDKVDIEPELEFKKVDVDFRKALNVAFVNRPEIRINLLMMEYHEFGKGIARAKQSLKVDLLGMWGLSKEEFASGYSNLNIASGDDDRKLEQQWYAGLKASMPLGGTTAEYSWTGEQWTPAVSAYQGTFANTMSYKFKILDKLDTYSDKQLAEIDHDKARQELIKSRQDITLEIKENCFNYEKAIVQLETATNKVKYQEKDLEFVKLKRSMGEADDSNIIESMIKLAQERFGYLQAIADCHISLATVNKAIGLDNYFKDEPKVQGEENEKDRSKE